MTLSELIKMAQEAMAEHGDVKVLRADCEWGESDIEGFAMKDFPERYHWQWRAVDGKMQRVQVKVCEASSALVLG